jgi:predicted Zn-dependent protease
MLVEQGQNQKALPHCEKGVELQPENSVSYSNYAELLINQGNLEEAETYCQQAEKTGPEQPDIYTVKAALLCEQGNEKQAKREYEKALTVDPAYEKAQYHYDQATTQKTERVGKWVSPGSEHWYT